MNVNVSDLIITSLETITAFDILDGSFLFSLEELQNATVSQSQDTNEITGKQGRRLSSLKRNKAVNISGDSGLVSAGLLELQTGTKFAKDAKTKVMWNEILTIAGDSATTTYKAVGTKGAEITNLFIHNTDGTLGKKYTQAGSAAAGKFAYNPDDKTITFNAEELTAGTEIFVTYERQITGTVLSNRSDTYSEKCHLYIDAICEDTCGGQYRMQIDIPKADFDGNWEMTFGDDQTVHSFEANALAGACGTAGVYFNWTVFGLNATDVDP